ncbi:MAG TPA: YcxB family protein [Panacibacter sp.]|nr:YcxB family protein [Panacibacter sp.]
MPPITILMQLSFTYNKKKVLQALRFHFIWQPEIRILLILVIVFDIASAVLYMIGKIRPEPFLLGSFIWLIFIISFWFILPNNIYKKSATFKNDFTVDFGTQIITLRNEKGYVEWEWQQFVKFFESPNFFHIYFSSKSFFLLPKDNMSDDFRHNLRILLNEKINPPK